MARQAQHSFNGINYQFSSRQRKWEFKLPSGDTFITPCPGGVVVASKVASILNGAVKRSNGVDGLARSNIKTLIEG